ncbi:hypothetical protein [Sphingomonas pokkalii]|uniref:Uncharacterized protein n=1 Tax=Sphingomonas pokkalii TaxID=2175090 RepID=A0A2U0S9J1_9SPHN|nr:hypothetical protein [Sphingomonas pokkalii]PVX28047.1 hypothetical protein DD559_00695 [Sphingomonas pokkalii]
MARILSQFTITPDSDGDYTLHLEDEEGETIELSASYEQLDLIVEAIEDALDIDEDDVIEVEDEEKSTEE